MMRLLDRTVFTVALSLSLALNANADQIFAIPTVTIDDVVRGPTQSMALYLKSLRESSRWSVEDGNLVIEVKSISECEKGRFVMVPFHERVGDVVRDGIQFFRCGKKIDQLTLDRTGASVKPLDNDSLFGLAIQLPYESETFRLRFNLRQIDIVSKKQESGRASLILFEVDGFPVRARIAETQTEKVSSEDSKVTMAVVTRDYLLEVLYRAQWSRVGYFEKREQVQGQELKRAPSYTYLKSNSRGATSMTSKQFLDAYRQGFESTVVESLQTILGNPGGMFPASPNAKSTNSLSL